MADKRRFSNDEFDDIDLNEEEMEYLNISLDKSEASEEEPEETGDSGSQPPRKGFKKWIVLAVIVALIGICAGVGIIIVKKSPSKKHVDLYDFYNTDKEETRAVVIMNQNTTDYRAYISDGDYYIPNSFVAEYITDKFYYDAANNAVLYTTSTNIYTIPIGLDGYYVEDNETIYGKVIAKIYNDEVYLNIDYVRELSGISYEGHDEPLRLSINSPNRELTLVEFKEKTNVRTKASIKGDIIGDTEETVNWYETEEAKSGWVAVISDDGREGYIKSDSVMYTGPFNTVSFTGETYATHQLDEKVALVWDGIYVIEENAKISDRLTNVEGVNVISPTWYRLTDGEGNFESLASEEYVEYVHSLGYKIWPLISDFNSVSTENGFDEGALLSNTEYRKKLIDGLMSEVETYGYDGINIDFEKIKESFSEDYIEFLRELSIECRKAEITLSVDNYPPYSFNEYYRRDDQNECVDYIIVMCYDEHYDGGEAAGSTASIQYVADGINNSLNSVDNDKLIAALPFYSRLWTISAADYTEEGNETKGTIISTKAYSMTGGEQVADEMGLEKVWNDDLKQTVASGIYEDNFYEIWLETVESLEYKLQAAKDADTAGVAFWSLGSEDPDVWKSLSKFN